MVRQVLSIEQCKELTELGISMDKASVYWVIPHNKGKFLISNTEEGLNCIIECYSVQPQLIPTFTLQDILEMLPKCITKDTVKYQLKVVTDIPAVMYSNYMWHGGYGVKAENDITLVDAAFSVLKWWKTKGCLKYVEYEQENKTST